MKNRGGSLRAAAMVMIMAVAVTTSRVAAKPTLHKVGGSHGWTQNINYTQWSTTQRFHLHDWLYFGFDKRYYNVLEVNKTGYESCNEEGSIKNVTRGGRDVFELTESRPYYFISGGGYCYHGMRLAVVVGGGGADDHDYPRTAVVQVGPAAVPVTAPASASAYAQDYHASSSSLINTTTPDHHLLLMFLLFHISFLLAA